MIMVFAIAMIVGTLITNLTVQCLVQNFENEVYPYSDQLALCIKQEAGDVVTSKIMA